MSIMTDVAPLTLGELRYLRKCVRKEIGLRKTRPTYREYNITPDRATEIRRLATSFVKKED